MTDRELMQQALEALERCVATCFDQRAHEQVMSRPEHFVNQNITAMRERLAQPEQEPVAWMWKDGTVTADPDRADGTWTPLYTTPPRREWVGLTDDEIAVICGECAASAHRTDDISYARAIEAKLKEKNNG